MISHDNAEYEAVGVPRIVESRLDMPDLSDSGIELRGTNQKLIPEVANSTAYTPPPA